MLKMDQVRNASATSVHVRLDAGYKNCSIPVDIAKGGIKIFLAFVGFADAFTRMKLISNPMTSATPVDIQIIRSLP